MGFYITYPKILIAARSTNPPGREEESMNILRKMMSGRSKGQLFPKEQGAKCSDVDSRTGTHPERGKQGRIRDCSQVQSRAQLTQAHDDEADLRS